MVPWREPLSRLGLALGSVAFTLLLAEAGLRTSGFAPEMYKSTARLVSTDQRTLLDCYPTNPRAYFTTDLRTAAARQRYLHLAPRRYDAVAQRAPWAVEFGYNSGGFRGPEVPPKRPGVLRVAVLGDSFTEGQGVEEPDTYPRRLEKLLNAVEPARFEVLNFGRRATDFPALYDVFETILSLAPDVIVYGMTPNDPERSAAFEARQNYVNDWILNRGRMLIGRPDHALGFFESRVLALMQDRIESYRTGRETLRWYREMFDENNREGWERTEAYLKQMNARTRAHGGAFLLVSWPLLVGLEGRYPLEDVDAMIARTCTTAGIERRDLLPVLRGRPPSSLWVHPVDMHPNELANRLAAESLAPLVRRLAAERQK